MSAITDTKAPPLTTPCALIDGSVEDAVRRRLEDCSYRFVFDKITWQFEDGTLTLAGCVPSFYLKQVLQELLLNIGQIDRIENDVAVVSSTGLSTERHGSNR